MPRTMVSSAIAIFAVLSLGGCQTAYPGLDRTERVGAAPDSREMERKIPYSGALGSPTAPKVPLATTQTPVEPWVEQALDTLYQRPSPQGPAPIALASSKAIYVEGRNPVVQVLPGPAAFPDKIPQRLKTVSPPNSAYSNKVERLRGGTIRIGAVDTTLNDTPLSSDWMAIEASFTDHEGAEWRIEQVTLAPMSSNPVSEPWLGGVGIDVAYHGQTGNGTPAEPLVNCALCSWGWADIYKDGKRVASSALLHVMVTSDTRNNASGFKYYGYDSTNRPVREIHIVVPPSAYLPSPGGFLHIMWENAEVTRGSPQQIKTRAANLQPDIPTIELSAVPYLKWDKEEIRVEAGKKYRLIVHNSDPSSFHQFSLHAHPESGSENSDLRHEDTMTAGRIGPLWKPGEDAEGHHDEKPPGPENVFFPLPQGSTWATMVKFDEPGEYPFGCPVANHRRRGMHGKFIVTAPAKGG